MVNISDEVLNNAIETCQKNEHYIVGIILNDYYSKEIVYKKIKEILGKSNNVLKVYHMQCKDNILFKNRSLIDIRIINNNIRGSAFHLLIVDGKIDNKIIEDELLKLERPYF